MKLTTEMDDLPDEMLEMMFSYCGHVDLVQSIQHVCRRWKRVSQAPQVWSRVVYRPSRRFSAAEIPHVLHLSPKLQAIDLQEHRFASDDIFMVIAQNCSELRKLLLHTHQDLSMKSLRVLNSRCRNLQFLKLTGKILMNAKKSEVVGQLVHLKFLSVHGDFEIVNLKGIADGSPRLGHLELIRVCYDLSDLEYLIQQTKDHLKTLHLECGNNEFCTLPLLSACRALTNLHVRLCNHDSMVEALGQLKSVTSLSWSNLEFGDVGHVASVFDNKNMAQLVDLSITCCYSYDDTVTRVIVKNCPALQTMALSCAELTNESLRLLGHLKNLASLSICWNSNITERGVLHLQNIEQLRTLALYGYASLMGYKGFTKASLQAVTKLHKLTVLRFHCQDLEDLPVDLIARRMTSLSRLDINKCFNVDMQAVEYLKKSLSRLSVSILQVPHSPKGLYGRPTALNAAGSY